MRADTGEHSSSFQADFAQVTFWLHYNSQAALQLPSQIRKPPLLFQFQCELPSLCFQTGVKTRIIGTIVNRLSYKTCLKNIPPEKNKIKLSSEKRKGHPARRIYQRFPTCLQTITQLPTYNQLAAKLKLCAPLFIRPCAGQVLGDGAESSPSSPSVAAFAARPAEEAIPASRCPPRSPPALLGAFPEDLGLGANGARGCPGPAQLGSCRRLCLPWPDRFASRFSFAPKSTAPPSLKKKKSFYFPSPSGGRREQRDASGAMPSESVGLGTARQRYGTETPSWPPRDPRGGKETPPSALPTPQGPAASLGAPGAAVGAGPAPGPCGGDTPGRCHPIAEPGRGG